MALQFSGTFEQLVDRLRPVVQDGVWRDVNDNQKQFRHKDGSILNWYPSTGTIEVQGRPNECASLEGRMREYLSGGTAEPQHASHAGENSNLIPSPTQCLPWAWQHASPLAGQGMETETVIRQDAGGLALDWKPEQGKLRIQMLPCSYIELELVASDLFNQCRERKEQGNVG